MTRYLMAVCACALLLSTAACNGEPEPAPPSAILPTPRSPASTTATTDNSVAALKAFDEGQRLAEELYQQGAPEGSEEDLQKYFTGSFLEYYEVAMKSFREKRRKSSGTVTWTAESVDPVDSGHQSDSLKIYACFDFSKSTTYEADGSEFDRGFDYTTADVVMERGSDGVWRAAVGTAKLVDSLDGASCPAD